MTPHHRQNPQACESHSHREHHNAIVPRIADCMTFRPYTVTAETTVAELLQLFEVHNYDCIPVVEREGMLLGILTDGDVLRAFEAAQNVEDSTILPQAAR